MNDFTAVEVEEAGKDLTGEIGEGRLVVDVGPFEGATVHVFEEDLDLPVVIEHVVAFDNVRVVDVAEDEDFTADLVSDGVFVVSVDDFEGVELYGWAVDDFVDSAAAAAADSVESFQRREIQRRCAGECWGRV